MCHLANILEGYVALQGVPVAMSLGHGASTPVEDLWAQHFGNICVLGADVRCLVGRLYKARRCDGHHTCLMH